MFAPYLSNLCKGTKSLITVGNTFEKTKVVQFVNDLIQNTIYIQHNDDDQVIKASDEHDAEYIFRKLQEEYELRALTNIARTEYLKQVEDSDLYLHKLKI